MAGFVASLWPRLGLVAAVTLTAIGPTSGDESAPTTILHPTDGSVATGELAESARPGFFCWQASGFLSLFPFAASRVNAIQLRPPTSAPNPGGECCFELGGGDVLFGNLNALDSKQAKLVVPRLGRLHIRRALKHPSNLSLAEKVRPGVPGPQRVDRLERDGGTPLGWHHRREVLGPGGQPIPRESVSPKNG